MRIQIHEFTDSHFDGVLALNNASTPHVNQLSAEDLRRIREESAYFRVAIVNNDLAGFLIAMDQTALYTSDNFLWFKKQYPQFIYIDRVAVAVGSKRLGVGRVLYADIQSFAEQRAPLLSCEVNLEPRNDVSLIFHSTAGFKEVGQLFHDKDKKRVALLVKELPAYNFVEQNKLNPIN
ncbi:MAG: GNAT family N-acetyltransferase [bacterium]